MVFPPLGNGPLWYLTRETFPILQENRAELDCCGAPSIQRGILSLGKFWLNKQTFSAFGMPDFFGNEICLVIVQRGEKLWESKLSFFF